jgi:UPF0755 protein
VQTMLSKQTSILSDLWESRDQSVPLASPEEALVLASIVEKETAVADERKQVASVFVNRLNQGMRLQTDPTVIYGITKGQGSLGRGLRQSELRGATPYNTYVINGLPPTPIANPGRDAIEAALNPDTTRPPWQSIMPTLQSGVKSSGRGTTRGTVRCSFTISA